MATAGGSVADGLRLAAALHWFWNWRRPREGRVWLTRLLARPGAAGGFALRSWALSSAATFSFDESDLGAAQAQAGEALALVQRAGDRPARRGPVPARVGRRGPR